MKLIINILFVLFVVVVEAQDLQVNYFVTINANVEILSKRLDYTLVLHDNETAYYNTGDMLKQFKYNEFIEKVEDFGELKAVQLSSDVYSYVTQDYFYTNHKKNEIIFNEILSNKRVIVKEKIDLMDWEISSQSDTLILKQKCKKAACKFRGREYTAYFSDELSNYGGPWKFSNLPGLVLYVKSNDNYFKMEATKIDNTVTIDKIKNPYEKEKNILSWDEFKKGFKQRMLAQFKKMKALFDGDEEGGSMEIKDRIEDLGIKKMEF